MILQLTEEGERARAIHVIFYGIYETRFYVPTVLPTARAKAAV